MNGFIKRRDLSPNPETEVLEKWVSPEGELEVALSKYGRYFTVTVFLVEVPEDGEEIPEGEEFVYPENVIRTESEERARARFHEQIPPSFHNLVKAA